MGIGMHNQGNGSAAPQQLSNALALPCDVSNLKKNSYMSRISLHNYSTYLKKLQKISCKHGKNECKLFSDQKTSRQSVVVAGQRNFP